MNRIGILFLFVIYFFWNKEGILLKYAGAHKGEKRRKELSRQKNRKREDSDDFIKEIAPLQTPRRSSKKRQSQPILNSIPPFPGKWLPILLYHEYYWYYWVYPSSKGGCGFIRNGQGWYNRLKVTRVWGLTSPTLLRRSRMEWGKLIAHPPNDSGIQQK